MLILAAGSVNKVRVRELTAAFPYRLRGLFDLRARGWLYSARVIG